MIVVNPRVFIVGDCAAVAGARPGCASAIPHGAPTARTLSPSVEGRRPTPYSMGFVGQTVCIWRSDAVVWWVCRDDSPRLGLIAGPLAARGKQAACRYARFGSRTGICAWNAGPR
ncbi:putative oxidoreductase (plasmid) [Gordonia polyisoprenivorans VH2]|uniref:Putative oxidoreductase n=1 Tax=Gordonia polyisoprenivorans (strain DSM 44266 / VH2) TaxID=1112204 RepID=H6N517_GORPV|nr:putative oxidoreductase [Gordonia polyisoprenivorans VH2]